MRFAVVYDSVTEQGTFIQNDLTLLSEIGQAITISSEDIMDGFLQLSNFDTVVFPGGFASFYGLKNYGESFADAVRSFVSSGGGYLGICGGAYIAARTQASLLSFYCNLTLDIAEIDVETPPVIGSIIDYIQGYLAGGQVDLEFVFTNHPIISSHHNEFDVIPYSRGPLMENPGSAVNVLAYFQSEGYQSKIAAIATQFGRGRVVLCSPHPEMPFVDTSEAALPWLYKSMATWVAHGKTSDIGAKTWLGIGLGAMGVIALIAYSLKQS